MAVFFPTGQTGVGTEAKREKMLVAWNKTGLELADTRHCCLPFNSIPGSTAHGTQDTLFQGLSLAFVPFANASPAACTCNRQRSGRSGSRSAPLGPVTAAGAVPGLRLHLLSRSAADSRFSAGRKPVQLPHPCRPLLSFLFCITSYAGIRYQ